MSFATPVVNLSDWALEPNPVRIFFVIFVYLIDVSAERNWEHGPSVPLAALGIRFLIRD